jgi:hypothetical protein
MLARFKVNKLPFHQRTLQKYQKDRACENPVLVVAASILQSHNDRTHFEFQDPIILRTLKFSPAWVKVITFRDFNKLVMCSVISSVFVRMPLFTEFSVLSLDVFITGITIDAEDFIVVYIAYHDGNQTGP